MFITRLWHYVIGYIIIIFEGKAPERFINMCTNKNIYLWDIKKKADELNIAKIGIKDFKKIRPIVRKTKIKVRIHKKRGIPFTINKYKKRRLFLLIGMCLFICTIYTLSLFIWSIEVIGNQNIPSEVILKNLEELGVKVGVQRGKLNAKELKNQMLLRIEQLAWINVDFNGTKVIVEIAEGVLKPEIIAKNEPCDIIASNNGIITKIIVHEGVQKAYINQTVKKGELLVSGLEQSKFGEIRYVHSLADIKLRTWYEEEQDFFYPEPQTDIAEPQTNITEQDLIETGKMVLLEKLQKKIQKDVEIMNTKIYTDNIEKGIKLKVVIECTEDGSTFRRITA